MAGDRARPLRFQGASVEGLGPVDLRENPRTLHMLGILRDQQDTKPQVIPRHVNCTGFRQIPRLNHDRQWDAITNAISFSGSEQESG